MDLERVRHLAAVQVIEPSCRKQGPVFLTAVKPDMLRLPLFDPVIDRPYQGVVRGHVQYIEAAFHREHPLNFDQYLERVYVVMKGIGADGEIHAVVSQRNLLGVRFIKKHVLETARKDLGCFNHGARNIDTAKLPLTFQQAGHMADRPARTAADVEKMAAGSQVNQTDHPPLHPAEVIKAFLVVGSGPYIPLTLI